MLEQLGYISGLCLGWCALPQVFKAIKDGHAEGVSRFFIWLWLVGEIGMTVYTLLKIGFDRPLLMNYGLNMVLISVLVKYSYWPRRSK